MDINRRLAELLQVPEVDFKSDARLVIAAMRERGQQEAFLAYVFDDEYPPDNIHLVMLSGTTLIKFIDLIMDKTGKLAKLATEWIERGVVNDCDTQSKT